MTHRTPPKTSLLSYFLPFVIIILLVVSGVIIVKKGISIDTLQKLFQNSTKEKEEKIRVIYSEDEILFKPWRNESFEVIGDAPSFSAGDSIKSGKNGLMVLRFFEGSEIRLSSESEIKLIRMEENIEANHIALELISGKLWRRGSAGNTPSADFIINTAHQAIKASEASVIDLSAQPESVRVLAGNIESNIFTKNGNSKAPLKKMTLSSGEQLTLNGSDPKPVPIDDGYFQNEWVIWNLEKELRLGTVAEMVTPKNEQVADLPLLEENLVTVISPQENEKFGAKVFVKGSYDAKKIDTIWVNELEATLGISGEFEARTVLSETVSVITITAQEKGGQKKLVKKVPLIIDATGPLIGDQFQPAVDANSNGMLSSDTLELIGNIGKDTVRVCVSHNDDEPYCLKQYKKGDTSFKYLGAVKYGNVLEGRNKYLIVASDEYGNQSLKTIYLFKGIEKPELKITEEITMSTATELLKPVIENPNPETLVEVREESLMISGKVDKRTQTILANSRKIPYTEGSETFEFTFILDPGENLIKLQSIDAKGEKSKTALLTVKYIERGVPANGTTPQE